MLKFYYGLRITDYGLRITDYGLRITDYGLRITDYGLRITDYGIYRNTSISFARWMVVAGAGEMGGGV
jgi:hypothetical protein